MNILILGGTGYLGSKLTRNLIESGHTVVCTRRESSCLSRLEDMKDNIRWTSAAIKEIEAVMNVIKFDYVINMICNYGKLQSANDDVTEANLCFPLHILHLAIRHEIKNFMTIDTGLPDNLNIYTFSKKQFREFGAFYAQNNNINFQNLIIEMFYGADEPLNRFFPSVITKMLSGETVETTIGTQKRDIISIDDVISAIMIILESDFYGFNDIPVGTGVAPKISEILDFIWNKTGKKSSLIKGAVPMRKNEPNCIANTTILNSICNWQPKYWKDGLSDMIETMKIMH